VSLLARGSQQESTRREINFLELKLQLPNKHLLRESMCLGFATAPGQVMVTVAKTGEIKLTLSL
jgi:hypothetical protein